MAMEPISSVVAFQAQNFQNSGSEGKAATAAGKTAEEFVEIPKDSTAKQVDQTTVVVKSADDVGIYRDGGGNQGAQEAKHKKKKTVSVVEEQNEEILAKEHERIREAVDEINKKMTNLEAQFGIHEETNRMTIKIIDKKSKEVIKEFPPEKALDMLAKTLEMAGLLLDEKY